MATLKNIAYLGLGTAVKMIAGLGALAVLARSIGTDSFGLLMIFLSAAGVICILSNLGLNSALLREVGRDPTIARAAISDALTAKAILACAAIGLAIVFALIDGRFRSIVFLLLFFSILLEGFTEFFYVGLRAAGSFSVEAKQSLVAAFLYSGAVITAALGGGGIHWIGVAYLISRFLVACIAYTLLCKKTGKVRLAPVGVGFQKIRETVSYSVDAILGALFGQVDGLMLSNFVAVSMVGVYQGGLRIFMSLATGGGILTNVLLPKISSQMAKGAGEYRRESLRALVYFSVFGNVVGWLFILVVPGLAILLYGPNFLPLRDLLPWFGLLFALRLVAGGWGLLLTAAGEQRYRSLCSLAHWLIIAASATLLVPAWGAIGWLWSLTAGTALLCFWYVWRAAAIPQSIFYAMLATASPLLLLCYILAQQVLK